MNIIKTLVGLCQNSGNIKIAPDPNIGSSQHQASQLLTSGSKTYTRQDVKLHNTSNSLWIIIRGSVYDVTKYNSHPGGFSVLTDYGGNDATSIWESIHGEWVIPMLAEFYIGNLVEDVKVTAPAVAIGESVMVTAEQTHKNEDLSSSAKPMTMTTTKFTVQEKILLNRDSFKFKMKMIEGIQCFSLPVGHHVLFCLAGPDGAFTRAYTPTYYNETDGCIEFVIKIYPDVPTKVVASRIIGAFNVGDTVELKGPEGHVQYTQAGEITVRDVTSKVKVLCMLCGGTGITPIYQILCAVLRDPKDATELHLLYSNRREEDILLRPELDALLAAHPGRLKLHYTLTSPPPGWRHLTGRVDEAMVRQLLPPGSTGTFALMCGPPGLLDVCTAALASHGFDKLHCVFF